MTRWRLRKRLVRVVLVSVVILGTGVGMLWALQRQLIYFPDASPVSPAADVIPGSRDVTLHTADGLELTWHTENPTKYPVYVHIGIPPVVGSDGVIYGRYQSPHLADTPITPASGFAD